MGHFLYAAKAFDLLEKLDTNPEYWEGKRGACAGVLQMIIAQKESKYAINNSNPVFTLLVYKIIYFLCRESIQEVLRMLRNTTNPQSSQIINVMRNWAKENKVVV